MRRRARASLIGFTQRSSNLLTNTALQRRLAHASEIMAFVARAERRIRFRQAKTRESFANLKDLGARRPRYFRNAQIAERARDADQPFTFHFSQSSPSSPVLLNQRIRLRGSPTSGGVKGEVFFRAVIAPGGFDVVNESPSLFDLVSSSKQSGIAGHGIEQ
jgi:hypothetical protein